MQVNNQLKLKNQLCFPVYLVAKEIITQYGNFLAPLDLTYTQYLVMMVLWEYKEIDMKTLGSKLFLDSSTLTPVVNRLIKKGYLSKTRAQDDKRMLIITLKKKGNILKNEAHNIPQKVYQLINLTEEESVAFYKTLHKIIGKLSKGGNEK